MADSKINKPLKYIDVTGTTSAEGLVDAQISWDSFVSVASKNDWYVLTPILQGSSVWVLVKNWDSYTRVSNKSVTLRVWYI